MARRFNALEAMLDVHAYVQRGCFRLWGVVPGTCGHDGNCLPLNDDDDEEFPIRTVFFHCVDPAPFIIIDLGWPHLSPFTRSSFFLWPTRHRTPSPLKAPNPTIDLELACPSFSRLQREASGLQGHQHHALNCQNTKENPKNVKKKKQNL